MVSAVVRNQHGSEGERSLREEVRLTIRLSNFPHIAAAFGEDISTLAVSRLRQLLTECAPGEVEIAPLGSDAFTILSNDLSFFGMPQGHIRWLDAFCTQASGAPFKVGSATLCMALHGEWDAGKAGGAGSLPRHGGHMAGSGIAWCATYRADMAIVARVLTAINQDSREWQLDDGDVDCLIVEWQPVCDAESDFDALYYQARLRMIDRTGQKNDYGDLPEILERMGFIDHLDRYLVGKVLDELEQDPDVSLGVQISALYAGQARWWNEIRARLAGDVGMAARLVIEINETAPFTDIAAVSQFISQMLHLRCKIELSGFGRGSTSIRELVALSPTFVKIDAMFLGGGMRIEQDEQMLVHLAGLCKSLGATVIADGINNSAQRHLALRAGIRWQQGDALARSGISRRWRLKTSSSCPTRLVTACHYAGRDSQMNLQANISPQ